MVLRFYKLREFYRFTCTVRTKLSGYLSEKLKGQKYCVYFKSPNYTKTRSVSSVCNCIKKFQKDIPQSINTICEEQDLAEAEEKVKDLFNNLLCCMDTCVVTMNPNVCYEPVLLSTWRALTHLLIILVCLSCCNRISQAAWPK